MLDEHEFRTQSDRALEALNRALIQASDRHEFESDMNNGALTIEFEEPPARFVVSPNAPVRQIWVSAHSKSFKLGWDAGRQEFVFPDTGQNLTDLLAGHISQQLGEAVKL